MTRHTATLRKGIVDARGEPGHRVFESNFVIDCTCGRSIGCATLDESTAERWRAEHVASHERSDETAWVGEYEFVRHAGGEWVFLCGCGDGVPLPEVIGDRCGNCDAAHYRGPAA